jgi:predicted dehydrogenase
MKIYHDVAGSQVETEIPIIESNIDLFDAKLRSFLDAIKEDGPSPVPSGQIIYNQAIIDGIAKSAAAGREIEIEIPEI